MSIPAMTGAGRRLVTSTVCLTMVLTCVAGLTLSPLSPVNFNMHRTSAGPTFQVDWDNAGELDPFFASLRCEFMWDTKANFQIAVPVTPGTNATSCLCRIPTLSDFTVAPAVDESLAGDIRLVWNDNGTEMYSNSIEHYYVGAPKSGSPATSPTELNPAATSTDVYLLLDNSQRVDVYQHLIGADPRARIDGADINVGTNAGEHTGSSEWSSNQVRIFGIGEPTPDLDSDPDVVLSISIHGTGSTHFTSYTLDYEIQEPIIASVTLENDGSRNWFDIDTTATLRFTFTGPGPIYDSGTYPTLQLPGNSAQYMTVTGNGGQAEVVISVTTGAGAYSPVLTYDVGKTVAIPGIHSTIVATDVLAPGNGPNSLQLSDSPPDIFGANNVEFEFDISTNWPTDLEPSDAHLPVQCTINAVTSAASNVDFSTTPGTFECDIPARTSTETSVDVSVSVGSLATGITINVPYTMPTPTISSITPATRFFKAGAATGQSLTITINGDDFNFDDPSSMSVRLIDTDNAGSNSGDLQINTGAAPRSRNVVTFTMTSASVGSVTSGRKYVRVCNDASHCEASQAVGHLIYVSNTPDGLTSPTSGDDGVQTFFTSGAALGIFAYETHGADVRVRFSHSSSTIELSDSDFTASTGPASSLTVDLPNQVGGLSTNIDYTMDAGANWSPILVYSWDTPPVNPTLVSPASEVIAYFDTPKQVRIDSNWVVASGPVTPQMALTSSTSPFQPRLDTPTPTSSSAYWNVDLATLPSLTPIKMFVRNTAATGQAVEVDKELFVISRPNLASIFPTSGDETGGTISLTLSEPGSNRLGRFAVYLCPDDLPLSISNCQQNLFGDNVAFEGTEDSFTRFDLNYPSIAIDNTAATLTVYVTNDYNDLTNFAHPDSPNGLVFRYIEVPVVNTMSENKWIPTTRSGVVITGDKFDVAQTQVYVDGTLMQSTVTSPTSLTVTVDGSVLTRIRNTVCVTNNQAPVGGCQASTWEWFNLRPPVLDSSLPVSHQYADADGSTTISLFMSDSDNGGEPVFNHGANEEDPATVACLFYVNSANRVRPATVIDNADGTWEVQCSTPSDIGGHLDSFVTLTKHEPSARQADSIEEPFTFTQTPVPDPLHASNAFEGCPSDVDGCTMIGEQTLFLYADKVYNAGMTSTGGCVFANEATPTTQVKTTALAITTQGPSQKRITCQTPTTSQLSMINAECPGGNCNNIMVFANPYFDTFPSPADRAAVQSAEFTASSGPNARLTFEPVPDPVNVALLYSSMADNLGTVEWTVTGQGFQHGAEVQRYEDAAKTSSIGSPLTCDFISGLNKCKVQMPGPPAFCGGTGPCTIYVAARNPPTTRPFVGSAALHYYRPWVITNAAPLVGRSDGGDTLVLSGTNIDSNGNAAWVCTFGGPLEDEQPAVVDGSSLRCTTPPHAEGSVEVWVGRNNFDEHYEYSGYNFTFVALPSGAGVEPVAAFPFGLVIAITLGVVGVGAAGAGAVVYVRKYGNPFVGKAFDQIAGDEENAKKIQENKQKKAGEAAKLQQSLKAQKAALKEEKKREAQLKKEKKAKEAEIKRAEKQRKAEEKAEARRKAEAEKARQDGVQAAIKGKFDDAVKAQNSARSNPSAGAGAGESDLSALIAGVGSSAPGASTAAASLAGRRTGSKVGGKRGGRASSTNRGRGRGAKGAAGSGRGASKAARSNSKGRRPSKLSKGAADDAAAEAAGDAATPAADAAAGDAAEGTAASAMAEKGSRGRKASRGGARGGARGGRASSARKNTGGAAGSAGRRPSAQRPSSARKPSAQRPSSARRGRGGKRGGKSASVEQPEL